MATILSRFYLGRVVTGHPRLLTALAAALVAYAIAPRDWHSTTRQLVAWDVGTVLYILLNLVAILGGTPQTIRERAASTDDGQFIILVGTSIAAVASMGAILAELSATKDMHGAEKGWHLALSALTIVNAWVFMHLGFAMHYAHEYFDATKSLDGEGPQLKGGLAFPNTQEPDYWDFLYFAFIIGVASQTADVSITSKAMRRTSLGHSILAFFFNSAILALTINIAAGLI